MLSPRLKCVTKVVGDSGTESDDGCTMNEANEGSQCSNSPVDDGDGDGDVTDGNSHAAKVCASVAATENLSTKSVTTNAKPNSTTHESTNNSTPAELAAKISPFNPFEKKWDDQESFLSEAKNHLGATFGIHRFVIDNCEKTRDEQLCKIFPRYE